MSEQSPQPGAPIQGESLTTTFAGLGIPEGLAEFVEKLGYSTPFEVQTATIPDALAGRDIAARAPTGSGKTLAFGLPLLMNAHDAKPHFPRGLVLAPTRELAEQIRRELEPIARDGGRSIVAIYGGVGFEPQMRALARGVDVLVACPGRLADLISQAVVDLSEVRVAVIDEADRMSDMGFLPEVKRLMDRMPDDRQTLLFSATLDGDVAVLTRKYQHDPAVHEVGDAQPNMEDVRHIFWRLDSSSRIEVASNLIQAAGPTIVFCRTRRGADRVAKQLERAGASSAAIHGSRSQNQRTRALKSFADGRVEALVATDVAARGIHVDSVACVLHFDPPIDDKTYIHRSGRTARAGAEGVVVSFVGDAELRDADRMVRSLGLRADLNTPAPTSLQGAVERLDAEPGESFADTRLAAATPRARSGGGSGRRAGARNRSRKNGARAGGDGGPSRSGGTAPHDRRDDRSRAHPAYDGAALSEAPRSRKSTRPFADRGDRREGAPVDARSRAPERTAVREAPAVRERSGRGRRTRP